MKHGFCMTPSGRVHVIPELIKFVCTLKITSAVHVWTGVNLLLKCSCIHRIFKLSLFRYRCLLCGRFLIIVSFAKLLVLFNEMLWLIGKRVMKMHHKCIIVMLICVVMYSRILLRSVWLHTYLCTYISRIF